MLHGNKQVKSLISSHPQKQFLSQGYEATEISDRIDRTTQSRDSRKLNTVHAIVKTDECMCSKNGNKVTHVVSRPALGDNEHLSNVCKKPLGQRWCLTIQKLVYWEV